MREIMTGRDIGTTIDFRTQRTYEARHPWPADTTVSAGRGVVFLRNAKEGEPGSYATLFMEVYPPGASFIRGEGVAPETCEDAAWAKYQLALNCSDGSGSHNWEPRKYRNGAGFCSRCNTFGSEVFTGEQLGQLCRICGTGTTYHWEQDKAGGEMSFLCKDHYKDHRPEPSEEDGSPLAALLNSLASDLNNKPTRESETDTMSSESAPLPLDLPEGNLALAVKAAPRVTVEDLAFARINFAESELWIQMLRLINTHGIPADTDPEIRGWAEMSFRLNEDTHKARQLRAGNIARAECMETNRRLGPLETVLSMVNLYRLLQSFHLTGVEVRLPDNEAALERFILQGTVYAAPQKE